MMILFAAVAFATATPAAAQPAPAADAGESRMHAGHAGRHCCCCCDGDDARSQGDSRDRHAPHADHG